VARGAEEDNEAEDRRAAHRNIVPIRADYHDGVGGGIMMA
jgi:hypothetical protein